ncbi:MAG: pantoate--beta-alanine ligase [Pseudomonadota bacterium]|nr:pantoate--beta-alanine ligase [Pseudomonadota bacterium]
MLKKIKKITDLHRELTEARKSKKKISLVPTMGNLHEGHLSLIKHAQNISEYVVVSIFVNPTQFVAGEDYNKYPRTLDADTESISKLDVNLVFTPDTNEIYSDNYQTPIEVPVSYLESIHCGKSRPGHFRGVVTVVSELFNIVQPDIAIFGEKDYQQLLIIRNLVKNLFLPIEIISLPTVREESGLAMSSRNNYLSQSDRQRAPMLYECIKTTIKSIKNGVKDYVDLEKEAKLFLEKAGFKIDYYSICDLDTLRSPINENLVILAAVWLGKTRLIDNARVHTYD